MTRKRYTPKKSTKAPEELAIVAIARINDAKRTGATKLDLSELELTDIPVEILQIPQLTSLNL